MRDLARQRRQRYQLKLFLHHDLPAGLYVFLVALPLCLGIALASGAPLYSGIISGIVGGLFVSLVSKSALGVSGPAAGLSTIVAASIAVHGEFRSFLFAVIIAGVFQIGLGVLRLGTIARFFPSAVIKGMLAAIGILLISKQIPVSIGYNQPDFWSSGFLELFQSKHLLSNLLDLNQHLSRSAILITLCSLGTLALFRRLHQPWAKSIPAPLLAVLTGVLCNELFSAFGSGALQSTQLVNIPANLFGDFQWPDYTRITAWDRTIKDGLLIGLVASLESLLCVEAIDKLDVHNRITPPNRELIAQGTGNILCGVLGGLPMTSVIVRGAANVQAGARSRWSAFMHGIFLLLTVLLVPSLLNRIPYAALSAILLFTGYNLTPPRLYRNIWKQGMTQFLPFVLTIFVILLTDLIIGVSIGLLIAIYFIVQNNFQAEFRVEKTREHETDHVYIIMNTNVTFLNKVKITQLLDQVAPYTVLTIDGSNSNFIDYDVREVISDFAQKAKERHIELQLIGIETVQVDFMH